MRRIICFLQKTAAYSAHKIKKAGNTITESFWADVKRGAIPVVIVTPITLYMLSQRVSITWIEEDQNLDESENDDDLSEENCQLIKNNMANSVQGLLPHFHNNDWEIYGCCNKTISYLKVMSNGTIIINKFKMHKVSANDSQYQIIKHTENNYKR